MIAHKNYKPPTAAEQRRINMMLALDCICCVMIGYQRDGEKIECHHLLIGNKRMGHGYTAPCCSGHHRGAWSLQQKLLIPPDVRIAISDGSKLFSRVYGTQRELWEKTQRKLGLPVSGWPVSKILPRRHVA